MSISASARSRIDREVARSFPEMGAVKPSVQKQAGKNGHTQYLLIYKGKADLPGGKTMSRIVRVVADDQGNIVRMSTSR